MASAQGLREARDHVPQAASRIAARGHRGQGLTSPASGIAPSRCHGCRTPSGPCGRREWSPARSPTTVEVLQTTPQHRKGILMNEQPFVVLVHGAFAESASWNRVGQRLQGNGLTAVAAANPFARRRGGRRVRPRRDCGPWPAAGAGRSLLHRHGDQPSGQPARRPCVPCITWQPSRPNQRRTPSCCPASSTAAQVPPSVLRGPARRGGRAAGGDPAAGDRARPAAPHTQSPRRNRTLWRAVIQDAVAHAADHERE